MINRFRVGYWYKWIGKPYTDTYMRLFADGRWIKCINAHKNWVEFNNTKVGISWGISFSKLGMSKWIESKYSPKQKIRRLLNENRR